MVSTVTRNARQLRKVLAENDSMRPRDLAAAVGVSEADLVAAQVGQEVTRIVALPDALMPRLTALGPVTALTRNESAVSEKTGVYDNYRPGDHAAMVLNEAIDLRIFPRSWVHGFAVERETDKGIRRSLQIFDAAGDAVHKVILPLDAEPAGWRALVEAVATGDPSDYVALEPRKPVEAAKADPSKAETLRREWDRMSDSHQFLRLASKLKMNRLGAYRIAGKPYVRLLQPEALDLALEALQAQAVPCMLFVGNRGCIQIHSGPLQTLKRMGSWQNVLDPDFNLHLRLDHVAEVWAVDKPTRRGKAVSIEAFDAQGALILQLFGMRNDSVDHYPAFTEIVNGLPEGTAEEALQ
ncbi:hemin-degrading factor [Pseudoruegeria sp. HB172150]|uniref:hemin-degrading factor n=1 Tax=Pseudoruegeria sp. HB172150 TaxID=2721164 RepID=UPI00352CE0F3